ncbi:hypothetical protein ACVWWO_001436 [Bradyrhizobium sp. F1.13.1]
MLRSIDGSIEIGKRNRTKIGGVTTMHRVFNHAGQLSRIAYDMSRLNEDSSAFGSLKIFRWFLYAGEVLAAGFGLFHLAHGATSLAIIALCVEVTIIIVHVIESSFERTVHGNHERRVAGLRDELQEKEDELMGVAEAHSMRVHRWYRRAREGY